MVNTHRPNTSRTRAHLLPKALLATLCVMLIGAASASAAVPKEFFGVSVVRPEAEDYKRMQAVGAGTVRLEIAWPSAEPSKHSGFVWGGIDQRVRRAATEGVGVHPVVFGTPGWVSGSSDRVKPPVESKGDRKRFQAFMRAVADRYSSGGAFWQENPGLDERLAPDEWIIWNEMNARNFWWPKVDPGEYAALLRIARKALDDVNPKLSITTGGMYGDPGHKNSMAAKKFLKKLYRQKGIKKIVDAVSLHPYASNLKGVKKQIKEARGVLKGADRKAGILIGEIGWASGGKPKKYFLIKDKKAQRRLLNQSYSLFLNKRRSWNIEGAMWFSLNDYSGEEVCNWCPRAGLYSKKGKLKPSGKAYKKLASKHARTSP